MKLNKRDCPIKARIKPLGCYQLAVEFDFGNDKLKFTPSTAMGDQFGEFVSALYTLYHENDQVDLHFDGHSEWNDREYHTDNEHRILSTTVTVEWDAEGTYMILEMTRDIDGDTIHLRTTTDYRETYREFILNDKDFCYAVAKACTEVLKEFGFYGYRYSTKSQPINLHQLLFIKAYALGSMESRNLTTVKIGIDCCKTDFEKEIELLLFDM